MATVTRWRAHRTSLTRGAACVKKLAHRKSLRRGGAAVTARTKGSIIGRANERSVRLRRGPADTSRVVGDNRRRGLRWLIPNQAARSYVQEWLRWDRLRSLSLRHRTRGETDVHNRRQDFGARGRWVARVDRRRGRRAIRAVRGSDQPEGGRQRVVDHRYRPRRSAGGRSRGCARRAGRSGVLAHRREREQLRLQQGHGPDRPAGEVRRQAQGCEQRLDEDPRSLHGPHRRGLIRDRARPPLARERPSAAREGSRSPRT